MAVDKAVASLNENGARNCAVLDAAAEARPMNSCVLHKFDEGSWRKANTVEGGPDDILVLVG